MEKKFKPFDKVIVRMVHNEEWQCDLYSHQDPITKHHVTVGFAEVKDDNILPYEGNERLVGTTEEPEEEIELGEGEWVVGFDEDEMYYPPFFIGKYSGLHDKMFIINKSCERELAIRFKDFDPSNMEETKKHILCVRNGKIVRYRE